MRNKNPQLEIIIENKEDAIIAENLGVDRLELIREIDKGGLTPDFKIVQEVTEAVNIPVYIMVRNSWDSYFYDDTEFKNILQQIEMIKLTKAKGIIFGSLNKDGTINEDQLKKIIESKGELELTYHRAVDSTINYQEAIKTLDKYDVDYVLTSGHSEKAYDGIFNLSFASRILKEKIIVGSGVTPQNCKEFLQLKNIRKLHAGSPARIDRDIKSAIDPKSIEIFKKALNDET